MFLTHTHTHVCGLYSRARPAFAPCEVWIHRRPSCIFNTSAAASEEEHALHWRRIRLRFSELRLCWRYLCFLCSSDDPSRAWWLELKSYLQRKYKTLQNWILRMCVRGGSNDSESTDLIRYFGVNSVYFSIRSTRGAENLPSLKILRFSAYKSFRKDKSRIFYNNGGATS